MALTKEQVTHVAKLAQLELSDAELEGLGRDLTAILKHVDQLQTLATENCPTTAHMAVLRMPMRADEPSPGVSHTSALRPAPKPLDDGFAVPRFVDEA